jgi:hypothetical protein
LIYSSMKNIINRIGGMLFNKLLYDCHIIGMMRQ